MTGDNRPPSTVVRVVRALQDAAVLAADHVRSAIDTLADPGDNLTAFEFDGRDELLEPIAAACRSLVLADLALAKAARFNMSDGVTVKLSEKRGSEVVDEILAAAMANDADPDEE
jgi:hypothetical protein